MSYPGPSIIGYNNGLNGDISYLTIGQYLHVVGVADPTKFSVQDPLSKYIFTVDTKNGLAIIGGKLNLPQVAPLSLLGSDASGNVIAASSLPTVVLNNVTLTGSTVIASGSLSITNSVNSITGVGSATKFSVSDVSSVSAFNVNTLTDAVTTKINTLDNGSGVASFNTVNCSAGLTCSGDTLLYGAASVTKFRILNSGGVSVPFLVDTSANAVSTIANILDDGSGNATFTNLYAKGVNSSTKFQVSNLAAASCLLVNTLTSTVTTKNNTLDNGSGTATFNIVNGTSYGNFGGLTCTGDTKFYGSASSTKFRVMNSAGSAAVFLVDSGASAVYSAFNTLDDGVGNASFASMNVQGNSRIQGINSATKFYVQSSFPYNVFTVNTISYAVSTKNNTLDDGVGNATFSTVNAANLVVTGSGTFGTSTASTNIITLLNKNTGIGGGVISEYVVNGGGTGNIYYDVYSSAGARSIDGSSFAFNVGAGTLKLTATSLSSSAAIDLGTLTAGFGTVYGTAGFFVKTSAGTTPNFLTLSNNSGVASSYVGISMTATNSAAVVKTGVITFTGDTLLLTPPVTFATTICYNSNNSTAYTSGIAMPIVTKIYYELTVTNPAANSNIGSFPLPTGKTQANLRSINSMARITAGTQSLRSFSQGYSQNSTFNYGVLVDTDNLIHIYTSATWTVTTATVVFNVWVEVT